MENIKEKVLELLVEYGFNFMGAMFVLMIGFGITNILIRMLANVLNKSKIDRSLHSFIKSLSSISLRVIIAIMAATMIGVPPTAFIAILSAAGLAIGLALKDSLSNFAGGIIILMSRPFTIGDFIDIGGYMGTVKDMQLLYTVLNTVDNKQITIPNGELANGKIINYSAEKTRRVDLIFGVSYDDDIQKVKDVLTKIIMEHELTFKEPEPLIRVVAYQDSSVDFAVKVWCQSEDYWSIYYDVQEQVKEAFDEAGISIPFPQTDVNLYQNLEK